MTDTENMRRAVESGKMPRAVYADWLEENGAPEAEVAEYRKPPEPESRWAYHGDNNLEYGGSFIDLSTFDDGYCNAVRVTDLDSGCGFRGAVMVEHITINIPRDKARIREAMRSCGPGDMRGFTKQQARHAIAEALLSYGHYDPNDEDNPSREILQLEADGPMRFDGWRANKRLHDTTLEAYVKSVHLEE